MTAGNGRSGAVTAITGAGRTLGAAVDAFLSVPRPDTTARTYAGTLERLAARLGRDRPLAGVAGDELAGAAAELWGGLAPRTWNRHVATVRSFLSWCRDHGWPAGDLYLAADRRTVPDDDSKAIPLPQLERLWNDRKIPLRERALWRLLYDSASRADAVLGLDVPDLDLANRQARARVKGGDVHLLHFQTAAARLLAKLTAGRESGPVFLTERRAASHRVTALADLDPESGKAGCPTRWPSSCSSRLRRRDPAPAPALAADPPRRAERRRAHADGHLRPPAALQPAAVRQTQPGRRRQADGRHRPGPTPPLTSS